LRDGTSLTRGNGENATFAMRKKRKKGTFPWEVPFAFPVRLKADATY
jgi:hypothetical protein